MATTDGIEQGSAVSATTATNDSNTCGSNNDKPVFLSVLYLLMFPLALLLNSVAAWVSLHLKSTTTFIVYLKNLIGADLLLTLTLPFIAVSDLPGAPLRLVILSCRFFSVLFYTFFYTSITFLGLISLDRFAKIVTPQSKIAQNVILSSVISVAVWMTIFGISALPTIILSNKKVNETEYETCLDIKVPAGVLFHKYLSIYLNVYFWCVSVVVACCYICITNKVIQSFRNSGSNNSKGKQKVKLRVFMVLVVFFASFGPYHIVRIPYTFQQVYSDSYSDCSFWWGKITKELSLWLASNNVCVDPLLYVFICREFNNKLLSLLNSAPFIPNKLKRMLQYTADE